MRSGMIKMLFVVVACGIMLPAGLWAQEDANIPWDPNTHLAPYPHVCALSTEYYIPEHGEVAWTSFDRRIKLSGKIGVTDPNRLIGLSENPDDILAWDAIGTPLDSASGEQGALIYTPLKYAATIWVPTMERIVDPVPFDFSVDLRQAPDVPFPTSLSRVEWSMNVLLSDAFETIDIPFAAMEGWIELTPGLEILVEHAAVEDGRYDYRMQARFDPNEIVYPDYRPRTARGQKKGYSWPGQTPPKAIVVGIDVLDAEGNSVHYQGSAGGHTTIVTGTNDSGGQLLATRTEIGVCSACGEAAFIRHTIAHEPYEQTVRLAMEDVLMPGL